MDKISINKTDRKKTKKGADYLLVDTSQGKMSVFDSDLFDQINNAVGKEIEAVVLTDGAYKNIVEVGQILGEAKATESTDTRKNVDAGNIVQRAVELTVAVIQNSKEPVAAPKVFDECLNLITEAFIKTKDKL